MSNTEAFREREQSFEAKFAHDEEMRFLAKARTDKLLAHWAATELDLSSEQADDVLRNVLAIEEGAGHEQAIKAYLANLLRDRPAGTDAAIAQAINRCRKEAYKQLGIEIP